jgi:hypothetical protein
MSKAPQTLDYAVAVARSASPFAIGLGFLLSAVIGGVAANLGYDWFFSRARGYHDDSLLILCICQAIVVTGAFAVFVLVTWYRVRRNSMGKSRGLLLAIIFGAAYGMIPAAGFFSSDLLERYLGLIPVANTTLAVFGIGVPTLLPLLLFPRQSRPRSSR